jgi:hypothetical protein
MNSNKETLSIKGNLNIVLTDAQGNIKDTRQVTNLVVSSGVAFILNRLKDNVTYATGMSHMEVGTSATVTASTQAALAGATGTRVVTSSSITATTASGTISYSATFGTGVSSGPLTEAGIFNASTGGIMLCRTVFPVINKGTNDTMTITWAITITPG